jgi:type II secretory pathway predicted ATPase ExeA
MIRSFFGIDKNPFNMDDIKLLDNQQDIYDILKVHSQQGGLCLLMGEPGTGKTIIKESIKQNADKKMVIVTVSRTLHTYINTIKILCQAFNIDFSGTYFKCEKRLIEEAYSLNRQGKMLILIIDDAHLMDINTLRRLRLLFEDFPKSHNIILIGQPALLYNMSLKVNEDIKSRVTYSTIMSKLNPDTIKEFIFSELDKVTLAHNIFTDDALELIIRSSDGILRRVRNLCLSCMLEAVRSRKRSIDLDIVNSVLIQPHWRRENDIEYL